MFRIVVLLALVSACPASRGAGPTVVVAPPIDRALGTIPVSAPVGSPIAITVVPRKRGDKTVRVVTRVDEPGAAAKILEDFETQEEVLEVVAGVATKLRILVVRANAHKKATLRGVYLVEPPVGSKRRPVFRETGDQVQGFEAEVVDDILDRDDFPVLVLRVLRRTSLRLGESIELTEDERSELLEAPARLTLVALDATTATYQIDQSATGATPMMSPDTVAKLRLQVVLERATGRPRSSAFQNHTESLAENHRFHFRDSTTYTDLGEKP